MLHLLRIGFHLDHKFNFFLLCTLRLVKANNPTNINYCKLLHDKYISQHDNLCTPLFHFPPVLWTNLDHNNKFANTKYIKLGVWKQFFKHDNTITACDSSQNEFEFSTYCKSKWIIRTDQPYLRYISFWFFLTTKTRSSRILCLLYSLLQRAKWILKSPRLFC